MTKLKALAALVMIVVGAAALVQAQGTPIEAIDTTPGQTVFNANCMACHQVTGAGIPAVFPPLKGHVPALLAVEGGRPYLVDVVLFGLTGRITIAEQGYNGMMPPWGHLSDSQLADVLNYVASAWDNGAVLQPGFVSFTPEEVLSARSDALDSNGVHAAREDLELE